MDNVLERRSKYSRLRSKFDSFSKLIFDFDIFQWFTIICILYIIGVYLNQRFVLTDIVYINSYKSELTYEQIQLIIYSKSEWGWMSYLMPPLIVLLKTTLVSMCLLVSLLWKNYKLNFKRIWNIVLKAETAFALSSIIIVTTFIIQDNVQTFEDIINFHNYSILAFLKPEILSEWMVYPLKLINVFELFFWIILIWGLTYHLKESFAKMLKIVAGSYGLGMIVWVVLVQLSQITFS